MNDAALQAQLDRLERCVLELAVAQAEGFNAIAEQLSEAGGLNPAELLSRKARAREAAEAALNAAKRSIEVVRALRPR